MFWIFNAPREYPAYYEEYYDDFDFYNGHAAWKESIEDIPQPAVYLFSLHWLHLEVHNGGFSQYFWNSTGTSAFEARDGFAAIGMPEVAGVVEQAMSRLAEPYPCEKSQREILLDDDPSGEGFLEFDRKFYDLADTGQFFRKKPKFVPFADEYAKRAVAAGLLPQPDL